MGNEDALRSLRETQYEIPNWFGRREWRPMALLMQVLSAYRDRALVKAIMFEDLTYAMSIL